MKSGVVLSTLLHGAVLTWGLWSLSAPEPLQMAPVESLPVDLVPIEEFSQSMIGAKDAPVTETPAPNPTETPETLPMPAENVGDNETDLATPPTPIKRPTPTEQAAAAQPSEPEIIAEKPPEKRIVEQRRELPLGDDFAGKDVDHCRRRFFHQRREAHLNFGARLGHPLDRLRGGGTRRQKQRQNGHHGYIDAQGNHGAILERFRINMNQFDGNKSVFRVGAVRRAMPLHRACAATPP